MTDPATNAKGEVAINEGVNHATSTLRGVEDARVKDMNVLIDNGSVGGYKVNLAITYVFEDGAETVSEVTGDEGGGPRWEYTDESRLTLGVHGPGGRGQQPLPLYPFSGVSPVIPI